MRPSLIAVIAAIVLAAGCMIAIIAIDSVLLSRPPPSSSPILNPSPVPTPTPIPTPTLVPPPLYPYPPVPAGALCSLTPEMMMTVNNSCEFQDGEWCHDYANHLDPCVFDICGRYLFGYNGTAPDTYRLYLGLIINRTTFNVSYYLTVWTMDPSEFETDVPATIIAQIMTDNMPNTVNPLDPIPIAPTEAQRFDWPTVESYAINASVLARELIAFDITLRISPNGSVWNYPFTLDRCPSSPLAEYLWLEEDSFHTIGRLYGFATWLSGVNVPPGTSYIDFSSACTAQGLASGCIVLFAEPGYYEMESLWDPDVTPNVREDFYLVFKELNLMFLNCSGTDCIGVDD